MEPKVPSQTSSSKNRHKQAPSLDLEAKETQRKYTIHPPSFMRATRCRRRINWMQRTKFVVLQFQLLSILLLLIVNLRVSCSQPWEEGSVSCTPLSSLDSQYAWESYNYYQILGLEEQPPPPPPSASASATTTTDGKSEHKSKKSRKFKRKKRASIESVDIRKAYRKQAQLYHPDKLAGKQKRLKENPPSNNSTEPLLSVEESTARFARIAQAYEVIADGSKRSEYDYFLVNCEDQLDAITKQQTQAQTRTQQRQSGGSPHSSLFEDLQTDPWRVFEDFFFGSSSGNTHQQEQQSGNYHHDSNWQNPGGDTFSSGGRGGSNGYPTKNQSPRRVFEREEFHYDSSRRVDVLRILRTEEFDVDPASKRYYFRVIAQDYVKKYDPLYGWDYQPITPRFVEEEGFREEVRQSSRSNRSKNSSSSFSSSRQSPFTILPGEYVAPGADNLLKSENGRYYAGISTECELLIMSDSSRLGLHVEDTTIWSSETYVPEAHMKNTGGCFLALSGSHLVLSLGTPERPGNMLWYSEISNYHVMEDDPDEDEGNLGKEPKYFVRLDNDGSLAVYKQSLIVPKEDDYESDVPSNRYFNRSAAQWATPEWWDTLVEKTHKSQLWDDFVGKTYKSQWWGNFVERTSQPRTRASKAWASTRKRVMKTIVIQKDKYLNNRYASFRGKSTSSFSASNDGASARAGTGGDTKDPFIRETCIYATGPAGCNTPGRKIIRAASEVSESVKYKMKDTITKVDKVLDSFVDSLNVDDEDDILDVLFRLLGKTSGTVGRVGRKIVKKSAHFFRQTIVNFIDMDEVKKSAHFFRKTIDNFIDEDEDEYKWVI